jgi:FkbM family methyltransferase
VLRRVARRVLRRPVLESGMAAGLRLLRDIGISPATVVDVGASDGRWSELALAVFPEARYVLFEPQPVHSAALDDFAAAHRSVSVVRSAVGAENGVSLFDAADPFGGVLQKAPSATTIEVPVTSLDVALASATSPFLVKLDTHGVEREILAGATGTLARSAAWIVEAYNKEIEPGCLLFWELCAAMREHGFRPVELVDVMHRPGDGTLWQMDVFFARSDWPGFAHVTYE